MYSSLKRHAQMLLTSVNNCTHLSKRHALMYAWMCLKKQTYMYINGVKAIQNTFLI